MTLKSQNIFFQKAVMLSLALSFTLFGVPESANTFQLHREVQVQSDTCCKNRDNKNCNCCSKHEENKSHNSDKCTCRVSKDMDNSPSSIPENIRVWNYYFFQTTITFPIDSISKNLFLSNLSSSSEEYIFLKAIHSTVIRI